VDHSPRADGHRNPKTFDEVIELGFPHEALEELAKANKERIRARPAPCRGRLPRATDVVAATTRKDQATLPSTEREAFRNAIVQLVEEGKYLELIRDHMDMSHNMHGTMGEMGLYRFLAWHRRYLVELERELQRVDGILRPLASGKLGIPYWRWQDPFPAWLENFLPANDPDSGQPAPARKNATPPPKANAADIDLIVNQFRIQNTGLPDENDYTKFTYGIEGWGLRPDGTKLPAHNQGHAWIGGIMNNTSTSPTDPMFWLHHAEIDRLWQIWRQTNPMPAPALSGPDLTMDPWVESYSDLLDISALGYVYDSMSL